MKKTLVILFLTFTLFFALTVPASASTDYDDLFAPNNTDTVENTDTDTNANPRIEIEAVLTSKGNRVRFIGIDTYNLNFIKFEVVLEGNANAEFEPFSTMPEGELTTSLIWATPDEQMLEFKWSRTCQDNFKETSLADIYLIPTEETETANMDAKMSIHVVNCICNCRVVEIKDSEASISFKASESDPYDNETDSIDILLSDRFLIVVEARTKDQEATVILAIFDEAGRMISVKTCPIADVEMDGKGGYTVSLVHNTDGAKVKAMLVKGFAPLCEAAEAPILASTEPR